MATINAVPVLCLCASRAHTTSSSRKLGRKMKSRVRYSIWMLRVPACMGWGGGQQGVGYSNWSLRRGVQYGVSEVQHRDAAGGCST